MSEPRKILVVDDVERNVALLGGLVRSLGHEVATASGGQEALQRMACGVDLVPLDGMMPDLDGFEVTRRARADAATRGLPIILVAVLESRRDRVKGVEAAA